MIRERLQQEIAMFEKVGHFALMQKFVLKHGQLFTDATKVKLGKKKECFKNSADLVIRDRRYEYFEGYLFREELPILIHHAWTVDLSTGLVADPTLREKEGAEYLGIHFQRDLLIEELMKNKVYGLLDVGIGPNVPLIRRMDPVLFEEFTKARGVK